MTRRATDVSLYLDETEIGRRVLGSAHAKQWPDIAIVLEREGLPRIDPLMGGRFWPAVEAYFRHRHGLIRDRVPAQADGMETWR